MTKLAKVTLLPSLQPSLETQLELQALLEDAQKGRLIGIAFTAMYQGREFSQSITGECRFRPVLTRGMVHSLLDLIPPLSSLKLRQ